MKRSHILIAAAVLAVAAFLAVRWYEKRQQAVYGSGLTQGQDTGSNLNSVAPELVGGSTGPSIGPALSTPITINVNSSAPPETERGANPVNSMTSASNTTRSPLDAANPVNGATGVQRGAPVYSDAMSMAGATSAGTGATYRTPAASNTGEPNVAADGPVSETDRGTTNDEPKARPGRGPKVNSPEQKKPIRRDGYPSQMDKAA